MTQLDLEHTVNAMILFTLSSHMLSTMYQAGNTSEYCPVPMPQGDEAYLKAKQLGKEVGSQIPNDDIESNAGSQHEPNHAAKQRYAC